MILRDIIERYELRNSIAVHSFFEKSLRSFAKEQSIKKVYDSLKSHGISITRESLYDFIRYFDEAFVILPLKPYSKKVSFEMRKVYLVDHGFAKLKKYYWSKNFGRILENIVFIQLKRNGKEVYYSQNASSECDFIIKDDTKIVSAIQVCFELNKENKLRELRGLVDTCQTYKLAQGLLLTYDKEDTFEQDGIKITVKPVWKWLLE